MKKRENKKELMEKVGLPYYVKTDRRTRFFSTYKEAEKYIENLQKGGMKLKVTQVL